MMMTNALDDQCPVQEYKSLSLVLSPDPNQSIPRPAKKLKKNPI
jgi:hypothetical protein